MLGPCEICGNPALHLINDLEEVEPEITPDLATRTLQILQKTRVQARHLFCATHVRPSRLALHPELTDQAIGKLEAAHG